MNYMLSEHLPFINLLFIYMPTNQTLAFIFIHLTINFKQEHHIFMVMKRKYQSFLRLRCLILVRDDCLLRI